MQLARNTLIFLCCTVLTIAALSTNGNVNVASAQSAGQCTPLAPDALKTAQTACSQAGPNSACLAIASAQATLTTDGTFAKQGDQVDLTKVTSLTTSAADATSANGGIVALKLQAGLPAGDPGISALLYGASRLTANVKPASAATAQATAEANANASDASAQAFTLVTGLVPAADKATVAAPACGVPPSGLLIQSTGDKTAHLVINGAQISFDSALLVIRAGLNDRLEVADVSGKVT